MIKISVESSYSNYSQYNMIIMCGGFDRESEQLYVTSAQKCEEHCATSLEAPSAHHIEVIIYFIPKGLPKGKGAAIADHPPFDAVIDIESRDLQIYHREHKINAWGGSAIKLNLEV
ncbi:MAG: hypothetical protein SNH73_01435 [Rikenellaceae bacterium]